MPLQLSNKLTTPSLRSPGGDAVTPPPPAITFYIELENGSGFIALESSLTDLLLQEAAP